jgi:hypothetical protein
MKTRLIWAWALPLVVMFLLQPTVGAENCGQKVTVEQYCQDVGEWDPVPQPTGVIVEEGEECRWFDYWEPYHGFVGSCVPGNFEKRGPWANIVDCYCYDFNY